MMFGIWSSEESLDVHVTLEKILDKLDSNGLSQINHYEEACLKKQPREYDFNNAKESNTLPARANLIENISNDELLNVNVNISNNMETTLQYSSIGQNISENICYKTEHSEESPGQTTYDIFQEKTKDSCDHEHVITPSTYPSYENTNNFFLAISEKAYDCLSNNPTSLCSAKNSVTKNNNYSKIEYDNNKTFENKYCTKFNDNNRRLEQQSNALSEEIANNRAHLIFSPDKKCRSHKAQDDDNTSKQFISKSRQNNNNIQYDINREHSCTTVATMSESSNGKNVLPVNDVETINGESIEKNTSMRSNAKITPEEYTTENKHFADENDKNLNVTMIKPLLHQNFTLQRSNDHSIAPSHTSNYSPLISQTEFLNDSLSCRFADHSKSDDIKHTEKHCEVSSQSAASNEQYVPKVKKNEKTSVVECTKYVDNSKCTETCHSECTMLIQTENGKENSNEDNKSLVQVKEEIDQLEHKVYIYDENDREKKRKKDLTKLHRMNEHSNENDLFTSFSPCNKKALSMCHVSDNLPCIDSTVTVIKCDKIFSINKENMMHKENDPAAIVITTSIEHNISKNVTTHSLDNSSKYVIRKLQTGQRETTEQISVAHHYRNTYEIPNIIQNLKSLVSLSNIAIMDGVQCKNQPINFETNHDQTIPRTGYLRDIDTNCMEEELQDVGLNTAGKIQKGKPISLILYAIIHIFY